MVDEWEFRMDHRSADLKPMSPLGPDEVKRRLFSGPRSKNLSRSRLLENLYMVAVGIRPASMFHPLDIQEMVDVRRAAESVSLGTVARKAGTKVFKMLIFSSDRAEMAISAPDLDESMGRREFIIAQITMANFTGAFLSFPKCCIDSFIGHLMSTTDQDAHAMKDLWKTKDPDPAAYFVERFVPCTPLCENAIREGNRIEAELSEMDPDLLLEYLHLRDDHMEEVREGRIVEEKNARNAILEELASR